MILVAFVRRVREAEEKSGRKVVHRKPRLLLPKTGS